MKKLLALLLLVFITGCGDFVYRTEGPPLLEPAAPLVFREVVDRGDVIHKEVHSGIVRLVPRPLSFEMEEDTVAVLGTVYVGFGETVTKGQLLARLDTERLLEQIEDRRERIAQIRMTNELNNYRLSIAIASLIQEQTDILHRTDEAFTPDMVARAARLEESIALQQLALAHTIEIQNRYLHEANLLLEELLDTLFEASLYAPFDGIVTFLSASEGQFVNHETHILYMAEENSRPVIQYVGIGVTDMTFAFLEDLVKIRAYIDGEPIEVELMELTPEEREHYVELNLRQGRRFFYQQFFPLRFNILADDTPPLGAFVVLHLFYVYEEDVLRLPTSAIHFHPLGDYVLRYTGGEPEQVYVEVIITTTYVVILSGLEEGDVVYVTR